MILPNSLTLRRRCRRIVSTFRNSWINELAIRAQSSGESTLGNAWHEVRDQGNDRHGAPSTAAAMTTATRPKRRAPRATQAEGLLRGSFVLVGKIPAPIPLLLVFVGAVVAAFLRAFVTGSASTPATGSWSPSTTRANRKTAARSQATAVP